MMAGRDLNASRSSSTIDGGSSSMLTGSRFEVSNSRLAFGPSLSDCEYLDEHVVITEIQEMEPTSAILSYCKRKFHRPFVVMLGVAGLRPMTIDPDWTTILGHAQTFLILVFLVLGYALQFVCGFRRDRGFAKHVPAGPAAGLQDMKYYAHYKKYVDSGEMLFTYLIPAILHLTGLLTAIAVYRIVDNEQLQSLIERVFILSNTPKVLVRTFWVYLVIAVSWLTASTAYVVILGVNTPNIVPNTFVPVPEYCEDALRILLYVSLMCHDLVQVVVICSYSIVCFLLRAKLNYLKDKLLLREIEPLDWMREICEFRKTLHHLNTRLCVPVCSFTLLNLSYTFSSIVHLLRDMETCPIQLFSLSLANILLWLIISLVPFFQAAALTVTCRATQSCGHLVSIRPFVHRHTASEDLNSILLYASSLKMNAKLFRMPINVHYLCFVIFCCLLVTLTFGMCLTISIGF